MDVDCRGVVVDCDIGGVKVAGIQASVRAPAPEPKAGVGCLAGDIPCIDSVLVVVGDVDPASRLVGVDVVVDVIPVWLRAARAGYGKG